MIVRTYYCDCCPHGRAVARVDGGTPIGWTVAWRRVAQEGFRQAGHYCAECADAGCPLNGRCIRAEPAVTPTGIGRFIESAAKANAEKLGLVALLSEAREAWARYSDGTYECAVEKHNQTGWNAPGQMSEAEMRADGCTCGLADLAKILGTGETT